MSSIIHLKIEQNNGVTEQVSPSVIEKLYEIVHSENLDSSSNLMGSLNTTGTYLNYVDYLEELFTKDGVRLLIITANKLYVPFADPEILRICATAFGDGVGVTMSELLNVTNIANIFEGNTNILTFNEFLYFTGITHRNVNWAIDDWFHGCSNLREITIPKNVENMYSDAGTFTGCTSLETVIFDPDSVITVCPYFYNCTNLHTVSLPDSMTTILAQSFRNTSLTTINTKNVTHIQGWNAFEGCTLTSANLPNVEIIGAGCFANCTNLESVTWNNLKITSIEASCFAGCTNLVINDLNLPNLTSLYGGAFMNTKVKLVSNLGSITSLGDNAFLNCTTLTSVDLSSCTSIGNNAFRGCTSLTTIDLSNVTSIGADVFHGCTSLGLGQTLELNLTDLTFYPQNALYGTKYTRLILHSPQLLNTYDTRYPLYEQMNLLLYLDLSDWRPAKSVFNNADYGDGSFYNNASLVTYIAPITVNNIGIIIQSLGNYSNFRYFILLPTTPPILNTTDSNNPPSRWFNRKSGNVHIYVPDSAKAAYLADTDWASIGGYNGSDTITDRLHGLSELPAGVWTTGLASLYLTPAQLATS